MAPICKSAPALVLKDLWHRLEIGATDCALGELAPIINRRQRVSNPCLFYMQGFYSSKKVKKVSNKLILILSQRGNVEGLMIRAAVDKDLPRERIRAVAGTDYKSAPALGRGTDYKSAPALAAGLKIYHANISTGSMNDLRGSGEMKVFCFL